MIGWQNESLFSTANLLQMLSLLLDLCYNNHSFGRSQYARGGLPDRAISTLKADHSPPLALWTVVQRERL
jgi:hypothetical protein